MDIKYFFGILGILLSVVMPNYAATIDASFWQLLIGMDAETWNQLDDNREPDIEQLETINRLIFRLRERVSDLVLEENVRPNDSVLQRGLIYQYRGNVTELKKIGDIYQVTFLPRRATFPDQQEIPVTVFTAIIPESWQNRETLSEPAGFTGILFKTMENRPIFVAKRMAWFPQDTFLGRRGFDVGLLDTVKQLPISMFQENRSRFLFGDRDREPFFSLLQTLRKHSSSRELQDEAMNFLERSQLSSAHFTALLFNNPERFQGTCVTMTGRAKKIMRQEVKNQDDVRRYGFDHYYMLFLFNDDTQANPAVFCVTELPEGMPVNDNPDYNELVNCSGVFYKTWAYKIRVPEEAASETEMTLEKLATQLAPMIVGIGVTWFPEGKSTLSTSSSITQYVVALSVFGVLAIIWFLLIQRAKLRRKNYEFKIGKSKKK